MEAEIKAVVARLAAEIRKDLAFFGVFGALVGWLMIFQHKLQQQGAAPKESWADALFSDFVSFNAFGTVFIGLIAIGSIATLIRKTGQTWPRLDQLVKHVENRLTQLASSIISFTIGLSIFSIAYAAVTSTGSGAKLAILILFFNFLIVVGYGSATLIARRIPPFDKWWIGLFFLFIAIAFITHFALYGMK